MVTARSGATATLLENGLVLIAGGSASSTWVSTAELYDPASGTFTATGDLNYARAGHTATLLPNGFVLIVGGYDSSYNVLSTAELYNPATGGFTYTGSLNSARYLHTATLLSDGMVLIAGGGDSSGTPLASSELYNPKTGTFSYAANLNIGRLYHTATMLNSGKVLIVGGADSSWNILASAELYDPAANTYTVTGSLNTGRYTHASVLLDDGDVLVAGGYDANYSTLNSAEVYNPMTSTFMSAGNLVSGRGSPSATLLDNGQVLFVGGTDQGNNVTDAELYDVDAGSFTTTAMPTYARYTQTATLLPNGNVLEAGGSDAYTNPLPVSEVYQPASLAPPNLVSITLTPANPSISVGTQQVFTATGTFSDNSTQLLASATWSSSSSAVASVTNDITDSGVAIALAAGSSTVSACTGSVCGSTALTVTPPVLVSIALSPQNPVSPFGFPVQFSVVGTYSDGTTAVLSANVSWASSAPSIATVNASGLATPVSAGTSSIQAMTGSLNASTTITVSPASLTSITVQPAIGGMIAGNNQQFTASATYSDGTINNSPAVTWTSFNTHIATVGSNGLVTAVAVGSTTIQASIGSAAGSATLKVVSSATLPTITASASPSANVNGWNNANVTVSFVCQAGSANIVTCPPQQAVSTEGASQLVSGTVTDAAQSSASASVTVNLDKTPPALSNVSPADGTSVSTSTITATGSVSDALSGLATVTCNGAAATVSTGTFSCDVTLNPGINVIMIRVSDLAGNVAAASPHVVLTTSWPAPQSIQITPSSVNLLVGDTQSFTAVDDQGHVRPEATWSVSDTSIAAFDPTVTNEITGVTVGQVTVTATVQGVTAQTTVNVLSSMSDGTVQWSVSPAPGSAVQQIVEGDLVPVGPDLFSVERMATFGP